MLLRESNRLRSKRAKQTMDETSYAASNTGRSQSNERHLLRIISDKFQIEKEAAHKGKYKKEIAGSSQCLAHRENVRFADERLSRFLLFVRKNRWLLVGAFGHRPRSVPRSARGSKTAGFEML